MIVLPPCCTLFPYTTLFRSIRGERRIRREKQNPVQAVVAGYLPAGGKTAAEWPRCYARSEETRLNSSHRCISYAVFCLKKKTISLVEQHFKPQCLRLNTIYL